MPSPDWRVNSATYLLVDNRGANHCNCRDMLLPREDAELVLKLHCALMEFVNKQLNIVGVSETAAPYATFRPDQRQQVVQAFVGRLDLIDEFILANPAQLSEGELEIVSGWHHLVSGRFIALRQLPKHFILLRGDGPPTAYGVVGLSEPIEAVIRKTLPAVIETVLLPFRGQIIYDGIVAGFEVTVDADSQREFNQAFRAAKASQRFLTALPEAPVGRRGRERSAKPKPAPKPRASGADIRHVLTQIVGMTDAFCQAHLSEEYTALCRKLAEKLAARRPSPLLRGKRETWACGIIRTIGWVNFLDDRSQSPHLKLPAIDRALGVAESTGQGKAKAIRQMLKIHQFDHRWVRPSQWESNPLIWTLQDARGFMIDIRQQPLEMQRAAFKQGLIPSVPADREAAVVQEQIAKSSSRRLFQFKVTLRGTDPVVWRRIQVWDDTLDKLHEHLQAAMGWTNSHLHQFFIQGRRCGDPELLDDGFEPFTALDSTKTLLSAVLPADGAPLSFEYHYDFGDSWEHDVLFEGSPPPQPEVDYPQCLEGERACPPEDVGGISGYAEYLEAITDLTHERHQELLDWSGPYNPNAFSPRRTTHVMQEGLPEWRKMV